MALGKGREGRNFYFAFKYCSVSMPLYTLHVPSGTVTSYHNFPRPESIHTHPSILQIHTHVHMQKQT